MTMSLTLPKLVVAAATCCNFPVVSATLLAADSKVGKTGRPRFENVISSTSAKPVAWDLTDDNMAEAFFTSSQMSAFLVIEPPSRRRKLIGKSHADTNDGHNGNNLRGNPHDKEKRSLQAAEGAIPQARLEWTAVTPVPTACGASVLVAPSFDNNSEGSNGELHWKHAFSAAMDPGMPSVDHIVSFPLVTDASSFSIVDVTGRQLWDEIHHNHGDNDHISHGDMEEGNHSEHYYSDETQAETATNNDHDYAHDDHDLDHDEHNSNHADHDEGRNLDITNTTHEEEHGETQPKDTDTFHHEDHHDDHDHFDTEHGHNSTMLISFRLFAFLPYGKGTLVSRTYGLNLPYSLNVSEAMDDASIRINYILWGGRDVFNQALNNNDDLDEIRIPLTIRAFDFSYWSDKAPANHDGHEEYHETEHYHTTDGQTTGTDHSHEHEEGHEYDYSMQDEHQEHEVYNMTTDSLGTDIDHNHDHHSDEHEESDNENLNGSDHAHDYDYDYDYDHDYEYDHDYDYDHDMVDDDATMMIMAAPTFLATNVGEYPNAFSRGPCIDSIRLEDNVCVGLPMQLCSPSQTGDEEDFYDDVMTITNTSSPMNYSSPNGSPDGVVSMTKMSSLDINSLSAKCHDRKYYDAIQYDSDGGIGICAEASPKVATFFDIPFVELQLEKGTPVGEGNKVASAFLYGLEYAPDVISSSETATRSHPYDAFYDTDGLQQSDTHYHGIMRAFEVTENPSATFSLTSLPLRTDDGEETPSNLVFVGVWIDDQMAVHYTTETRVSLADIDYPPDESTEPIVGGENSSGNEINSSLCAAGSIRNLALLIEGASIESVSSNFGSSSISSRWGANKAIDGDSSTAWSSAGDGNTAYISIQLPFASNVVYVDFHTRTMGNSAQIFEYEVGFDDEMMTKKLCSVPDAKEPYECILDGEGARAVNVVTFQVVDSSGGNTGAVSVGVYGCDMNQEPWVSTLAPVPSPASVPTGEDQEPGDANDPAIGGITKAPVSSPHGDQGMGSMTMAPVSSPMTVPGEEGDEHGDHGMGSMTMAPVSSPMTVPGEEGDEHGDHGMGSITMAPVSSPMTVPGEEGDEHGDHGMGSMTMAPVSSPMTVPGEGDEHGDHGMGGTTTVPTSSFLMETTNNNTSFCPEDKISNLALIDVGASIESVSSNFGSSSVSSTWGANNAIDGDPSTAWSSAGDGDGAYISVRLPFSSTVTYVELHTRTMGNSAQIFEYEVEVTNDDMTYSMETTGCQVLDADGPYECVFDQIAQNVTVVTFRVTDSSGGNTGAVFIGVYGCNVEDEMVASMSPSVAPSISPAPSESAVSLLGEDMPTLEPAADDSSAGIKKSLSFLVATLSCAYLYL